MKIRIGLRGLTIEFSLPEVLVPCWLSCLQVSLLNLAGWSTETCWKVTKEFGGDLRFSRVMAHPNPPSFPAISLKEIGHVMR